MMDSEAWRDLSGDARAVYLEIAKRYNGTNNGFIVYSVREGARDLKVGYKTAARRLNELVEHGFIFPEQRGAFHWKIDTQGFRRRPATEWRLTCYDSDRASNATEKLSTKEFMRWRKGDVEGRDRGIEGRRADKGEA
jgi:hypothetical protein